MNSFQKTILGISCVVLILSLVIVGYTLSKSLHKDAFPPIISDCPDYWDVSNNLGSSFAPTCISSLGINKGSYTSNEKPSSEFITSDTGNSEQAILCNKYKWANSMNIVWDGVTNNSKPCDFN